MASFCTVSRSRIAACVASIDPEFPCSITNSVGISFRMDATRLGLQRTIISSSISSNRSVFFSPGSANFRINDKLYRSYNNAERLAVVADSGKNKKSLIPSVHKVEEKKGVLGFVSKFKLVPDKKFAPVVLPVEKEIVQYQEMIEEVKVFQRKTGQDFSHQIVELEGKLDKLMIETYERVTPVDRLSIARHPNRPTFLDHVLSITDRFVELHGDRGGYNDPAIVCGIGSIEGMSFMFIGHQKGRNTKENIQRNFGMPTPNGYRKALRFMKHADHHGFPIVTFVDTPGAHASIEAEELGQGEAIARNLRDMFDLRVPSISIVIGEGGSGGALAIGCCNKMLMLENSVYFVASPEACAAILWKSAAASPKAATQMRITAPELLEIGIVDEIIPEPLGGAHKNPSLTSQSIKTAIMKQMKELLAMDEQEIMRQRWEKFRYIGGFLEGPRVSMSKKFSLKRRPKSMEYDPKPKTLEHPTQILTPEPIVNDAKNGSLVEDQQTHSGSLPLSIEQLTA